jgi:excisionase family DNA binding protein
MHKLSYSVAEACEQLGIARSTLYGLIAAGRLPARKLNNRTIFLASDLQAFLDALPYLESKRHDA